EIEIVADVSIDQLMARHFAGETQVPSLELSMDVPANAGACTGNLSCVYTHTLSWKSPTQPLPVEWNPRAVFEKLFGDSGSTDRAAREARLRQHKSILDSVNEKLAGLKRELGPGDQVKVDEYTDAVRDVERRIQKAEEQSNIELPAMEQPQGAPPVFEDHLALMFDLKLLAFQSDLTRVISFMIGKEQSARPYPQIGVPEAHHPLSHHNDVPEIVAQMSKINRYHAELFSKYLAKLRATPDGDGSLLDHMTILYGSGISNSTRHSGDNLPVLVVGGGGIGATMRIAARWPLTLALAVLVAGTGRAAGPSLVDAAKNADKDAVRALLQQGSSVNAAEGDGTTALHWASYRDDLESADLLI